MSITAEDFLRELYESCDNIVACLNIINSNYAIFKSMPLVQNAIMYNLIHIYEIICNIVSHKDDMGNEDIANLYNLIKNRYNVMKDDLKNCRNSSAHGDVDDAVFETAWHLCINDVVKLRQELESQYMRKIKSNNRKLLYAKEV